MMSSQPRQELASYTQYVPSLRIPLSSWFGMHLGDQLVAHSSFRKRNAKLSHTTEPKPSMLDKYIYSEPAVSERLSQRKPASHQESVSDMVGKLRKIEKAIEGGK